MTEPPEALRPATAEELEFSIAHALRFDGKKRFRHSDEAMAKITAAHLVERLRVSGFVVMKKPPAPMHSASPHMANKHLTE